MSRNLAWLLASAVALLSLDARAETKARQPPRAVWMSGSDIPSPEVLMTRRLRDSLEAEIAARNPGLTPQQAIDAEAVLYLPDFVKLASDRETFRYRVLLTDRSFHASAEAIGTCRANALEACARRIYRQLAGGDQTQP